ncbi:MAG: hypothetical protein ABSA02_43360 [Trebonia sp.]
MSALPLADGPAYYFGSTIMTFALPYGAFIAAAVALFYLFRARHSGPRLRWSTDSSAQIASVTTREPGPAPAPEVLATSDVASVAPEPLEEDVLAEQAASTESAPEEAAPTAGTAAEETQSKDGGEE